MKLTGTDSDPTRGVSPRPPPEAGSRIVALARDPNVLYSYWDLSADVLVAARSKLGSDSHGIRLVVRAYDTTGRIFDGDNARAVTEFDVTGSDQDAFLEIAKPATRQVVEIGIANDRGEFHAIARSSPVDMPPAPRAEARPATEPARWMTVTPPASAYPVAGGLTAAALAMPPTPRWAGAPAHQPGSAPGPGNLVRLPHFSSATLSPGHELGLPSSPSAGFGAPTSVGASEVWVESMGTVSAKVGDDAFVIAGTEVRRARGAALSIAPALEGDSPRLGSASNEDADFRVAQGAEITPGAMLEPSSPVRGAELQHPSAAEGVWSAAEVSDAEPAPAAAGALEGRPMSFLPERRPVATTGTELLAPEAIPGWDRVAAGLGLVARGTAQIVKGALGLMVGMAELSRWALRKLLDRKSDDPPR